MPVFKSTAKKTPPKSRGKFSLKAFLRQQGGSVAVYAGLSLPVVAGLAGFGLDTSVWYAMKRDVQGMADAAAVAAALAQMDGLNSTDVKNAAITEATRNGYDAGACPDTECLVLTPVANAVGDATETIQITVRQEAPMRFAGLFMNAVHVSGYASAGTKSLGSQCVLALDSTASGAITFTGNTSADVGCGVTSNSNHASSLIVTGSATLIANPVQAHGGISVSGSGNIQSDYPLLPFSPSVSDPYASFTMPTKPASCDYSNETVKPNETANYGPSTPGGSVKMCGQTWIKGEATFDPGIYFIDGGNFRMNSGAVVNATGGVTFILTADSPSNIGEWMMNGQAELYIDAPGADGHPTQGMAIIQDPNAPSGVTNKINGGSDQQINGVVYFPSQEIEFTGGSNTEDSCVQIIANTVDFRGNSFLENDADVCGLVGVSTGGTGGGQQVVLVR